MDSTTIMRCGLRKRGAGAVAGWRGLVDIIIDTDGRKGDATSTITATDGHPFRVVDGQVWK